MNEDPTAQFRLVARGTAITFGGGLLVAFAVGRLLSAGAGLLSAPNPVLILYPPFALFLLVAVVLSLMGYRRIGGVLSGYVSLRFYRTYDEGEEPADMRVITRNFINLFEMPMLFYVVVLMAYVSHQVSCWIVGLAWAYVALRYLHSGIHITSNNVALRLAAYAGSGLILLVTWATLFVTLLREA